MKNKFEKIGSPQTKFIINEYDKMYNKYFNKFRLVPITGFMNSKIRERDKLLYNDTTQILKTIKFYSKLWECPVKLQDSIHYSNVQLPFMFGDEDSIEKLCNLSMNEDKEYIKDIYNFVLKIVIITFSETLIEKVFSI